MNCETNRIAVTFGLLLAICQMAVGAEMKTPRWRDGPSEPAAKDISARELDRSKANSGALEDSDKMLEDGHFYDIWYVPTVRSEKLRIDLVSPDFDSYLMVLDPEGQRVAENDDVGESSNSGTSILVVEPGTYSVVVTSYEPAKVGTYSLELQSSSIAVDDPSAAHALLVGVEDYPGFSDDLIGVSKDVELIEQALSGPLQVSSDKIMVLKNEEATRHNVLAALDLYLGSVGTQGSAVFFYSGHGTQTESNEGWDDPEPDGRDEALYVVDGLILDDELSYALGRLQAENVLVIFDSCNSGTATRVGDVIPKSVALKDIPHVRLPSEYLLAKEKSAEDDSSFGPSDHVFLASSLSEELSYMAPEKGSSAFTYFLATALSDLQPGNTFEEFMGPVGRRTKTYVADYYGEDQTPQCEGTRRGEEILAFLR